MQVVGSKCLHGHYVTPGAAVIPVESSSTITRVELSSARVLCVSISFIELYSADVDALRITADCQGVLKTSLLSRKEGRVHKWNESLTLTIPADASSVSMTVQSMKGDQVTQVSEVSLSLLNLPVGAESDFDDSLVITCDIAADNNDITCTTANSVDYESPMYNVVARPCPEGVACGVTEKYSASAVMDFDVETSVSNAIDVSKSDAIPQTAIVQDSSGRMNIQLERDGVEVGSMTLQMLLYLSDGSSDDDTSSSSCIEPTPHSSNIQFCATAKTFSHLLHIDSHKLQEIINTYRLCERPVLERFVKYQSKVDKNFVQRASENNQSIILASVLINSRRGRQKLV